MRLGSSSMDSADTAVCSVDTTDSPPHDAQHNIACSAHGHERHGTEKSGYDTGNVKPGNEIELSHLTSIPSSAWSHSVNRIDLFQSKPSNRGTVGSSSNRMDDPSADVLPYASPPYSLNNVQQSIPPVPVSHLTPMVATCLRQRKFSEVRRATNNLNSCLFSSSHRHEHDDEEDLVDSVLEENLDSSVEKRSNRITQSAAFTPQGQVHNRADMEDIVCNYGGSKHVVQIPPVPSNGTGSCSSASTSFRFASFPASLPRVDAKGSTTRISVKSQNGSKAFDVQSPFSVRGAELDTGFQSWNTLQNSMTVRKRMNFGGEIVDCQETPQTECTVQEEESSSPIADPIVHEDVDDSHNTSMSSLSMDGIANHQVKTPGVTRQIVHGHGTLVRAVGSVQYTGPSSVGMTPSGVRSLASSYPYPAMYEISSGRDTDRAVWMSPVVVDEVQRNGLDTTADIFMRDEPDHDDESPSLRTRLNFNTLLSPSNDVDVGVRKRHSIGDEFQSPQDDTVPARKIANRKSKNPFLKLCDSFPPGVENTGFTARTGFTPYTDNLSRHKLSPTEEHFRMKLDSTQCSPIQSIEDADLSSGMDMDIEKSPQVIVEKKGTELQSPSHSTVTSTYSGMGSISSSTSRSRKLRPMPDMSAFDAGANETISSIYQPDSASEQANVSAASSNHILPSSPIKALCPPTPLRTPAWALKNALSRSNSLVSNKLLAACPPQVIDEFSSLEDSLCMDNTNSASSNVEPNSLFTANSCITLVGEDGLKGSSEGFSSEQKQMLGKLNHVIKTRNSIGFKTIDEARSEMKRTEPESKVAPMTCNKNSRNSRMSTELNQSEVITFDVDFDNVSLLGRGAFANVYKARSKKDGQFYAVKKSRQQFRGRRDRDHKMAEIRIMQKLQNASLMEEKEACSEQKRSYCLYLLFFIKAWQEDGFLFCQTELCCRDTCQNLILNLTNNWEVASKIYPSLTVNLKNEPVDGKGDKSIQRLVPDNTIWKVCHDVLCGLSHIHGRNIVHHDIKPANIFFVHNPKLGALCKIGDFGMAGETGSVQDGHEGDTAYMPGELLDNPKKDPKGDIFSLGVTLYELAASGNWIVPREGYRWLNIRDASHIPEIPKSRGSIMINLIKQMINPDKDARPSADDILAMNSFLQSSVIQADGFLTEYVKDVNKFYAARENEAMIAQQKLELNRRTPTHMLSKPNLPLDRSWSVRTPTPGSGSST